MSEREIAVTFDDGPNPPYTEQILDILEKYNAQGTFFLVGANVEKHPELVRDIHERGHSIGNHTYNHGLLETVSGNVFTEVLDTQKILEELVGDVPKLYRSPFGASPPWLLKRVSGAGFSIAPTTQAVWGHDYLPGTTVEGITQRVLKGIEESEKSIILLHDGNMTHPSDKSKTVEALEIILEELSKKGYSFTTLEEIMKQNATEKKKFRKYFYP